MDDPSASAAASHLWAAQLHGKDAVPLEADVADRNLIAGEWVGSNGSENINPSDTGDVVGVYAQATADEARQAIAAAKAGKHLIIEKPLA